MTQHSTSTRHIGWQTCFQKYLCLCEFGADKAMSARVGTSNVVLAPIWSMVTPVACFVEMSNRGREACTHYVVISTLYNNKTSTSMALMKVHPLTGRTHQIRVHMASTGMPLVGEQKYRAWVHRVQCGATDSSCIATNQTCWTCILQLIYRRSRASMNPRDTQLLGILRPWQEMWSIDKCCHSA